MRFNKNVFERKLAHTLELLRKAERVALTYDKEDGFYLAFSGGKDSQALYHAAQMAGVKFKAHMSLTSVDPPDVIRFVKQHYPDVVRHKPATSMYAMAVRKQLLPSMHVRWCCAEFKESAGAGKVTLIGIRKHESARRAKRHEVEVSRKKFSGDFDAFEEWSKEEIAKKINKTKRKVNEDEFSVTQENEIHCINGKDSILISPIFDWTDEEVWYFLNEVVKVPHCKLYDEGYTRIGCILCPMASRKSKLRDIKRFPHVKDKWIEAIKKIRMGGVFPNTHIPKEDKDRMVTGQKMHTKIIPPPTPKELWGNKEEAQTDYYGTLNPQYIITHRTMQEFSISPAVSGETVGQTLVSEDEIAECIFDWWVSGLPYRKWWNERFRQRRLEFFEEDFKRWRVDFLGGL